MTMNDVFESGCRMLHSMGKSNSGLIDDHTADRAGNRDFFPFFYILGTIVQIYQTVCNQFNRIQCQCIRKWLCNF